MLVLTRQCGEQIVIADDIIVTVASIDGNKVRLGIQAPKSIRVDRKEVYDRRLADAQDDFSPVNYQFETGRLAGASAYFG